jgi:Fur family transcriptional regulator, ferric uptake regulator
VSRQPVLEAFLQALTDKGLKSTKQREAIVEMFFGLDRHISVEDLLMEVRSKRPNVGYATVYRTLKLLVELGFALERHFGGADQSTLYDPLYGRDEHYHLICQDCHHIIEFEDNDLDNAAAAVAARLGFRVSHQRLEIYGICQRVACERRPPRPAP